MSIIQLSKLLGNYNCFRSTVTSASIIQLSKLLGNYNIRNTLPTVGLIIQLSKLLGNYNEKSAHRWVGNFSLQILTDLHPSKIPLHGEFPVSQAPAFGLEDAVCGKGCKCDQDFLLTQHTRGMTYQPH